MWLEKVVVYALLILLIIGLCLSDVQSDLGGFLDRPVDKPFVADNSSSLEHNNERISSENPEIADWLKKIYEQFISSKEKPGNTVEIHGNSVPTFDENALPSSTSSNDKRISAVKPPEPELMIKKTAEASSPGGVAPNSEGAGTGEGGKEVYLEDLTNELDRLLKLFGKDGNKRNANSVLAEGVTDLHKIADSMEQDMAKRMVDADKHASPISDDGRARPVDAVPSTKREVSLNEFKNRFYAWINKQASNSGAATKKEAKSAVASTKRTSDMSLDDLYNELKRETMLEKQMLQEKNAVASSPVKDAAKESSVSSHSDAAFYDEKKRELINLLNEMLDSKQNGKLTNFGKKKKKKDDPARFRDEMGLTRDDTIPPNLKADEIDPKMVFHRAYKDALAEYEYRPQKKTVPVPKNVFNDAFKKLMKDATSSIESRDTSVKAPLKKDMENRPLPYDISVEETFKDLYDKYMKRSSVPSSDVTKKSFIDTFKREASTKSSPVSDTVSKVFDDAYQRSLKSTQESVKKIFKDAYDKSLSESKRLAHEEVAPVDSNMQRKREIVKNFLVDFAAELKREKAAEEKPSTNQDYASELETAASTDDKRVEQSPSTGSDSNSDFQKLEQIIEGFETAADLHKESSGRP